MKKQEDTFQSLVFEQEEMESYWKYLKEGRGDWSERFILWTSKVSNYYGKDWVLPVIWMIIFNFLFFILIGAGLVTNRAITIDDYLSLFGRVTYLFNPAHQVNNIHDKINLSNFSLVFDFISRIFTSYFIFQTIKAFRKYSK
ncbi:hypothetical protein EFA69_15545 [Rufibacter immobilis]|uniref:Uncharacterized protein n=1 Tax=Rufibacter immobilis TaxID=1348778 RepID=A0A3M9MS43_9BACT|nr:hypothetical protein [Rufibacter immobilis]RNI27538.1 hypothetical protein EFA69_15545 [Rufibacter immobilis]